MSLSNIGRGALAELFDRELQDVLANIRDPNSDIKKPSAITIKVIIEPDENRSAAKIKYSIESRKAPPRIRQSTIMFGVEDGEFIANEIGKEIPGQQSMNITPIRKEGE